MKSIFTEKEHQIIYADTLRDGKKQPLHRLVSTSHLSIARHYGGMKINGEMYTYFPATDELVSLYALKALQALRKEKNDSTAIGSPQSTKIESI